MTRSSGRRIPLLATAIVLSVAPLMSPPQTANPAVNSIVPQATWAVTQIGSELQISYGNGASVPQYGALHLTDSYFRLNYGPGSGWGTSVILLPALWSSGTYYQGAPISATWQAADPNMILSITGTIASLNVSAQVNLSPPTANGISAQVTATVTGSVTLDNRFGEAFKPMMLSSMRISPTMWDTQLAFANCQTIALPVSNWIIQPQPPVTPTSFGLLGGTSDWKTNATSIAIVLDQPRQVAGWVTASNDPNDDNIGLWAASDGVLSTWSYRIVASPALQVRCQYLPVILLRP